MAEYQPWMTKYRPTDFSHVVGQNHIIPVLKGMLQKNSLAPSLIFTGGHGRGKTTLARLFAKSLLCHNPSEGMSCGQCPSCKSLLTDLNPNFIEKDAASTGKIADIRELLKLCSYPPMGSSRRVILLDEAQKISSDGWNALLKTLEEPPSHTVFLFCTTEIEKIPATILSRSKVFYLNPIQVQDTTSRLKYVLTLEGIPYEEQALSSIAEASEGHLRNALNLLEQIHLAGDITSANVLTLTNRVDSTQIKTCLQGLIQDPMTIFQEVPLWMSYMTPEDIFTTIQTLLVKHQLSLWKVGTENTIPGWGDVTAILTWLSSTNTPTTLNQLNGALIQLVSRIRPAASTPVDLPFVPQKSTPEPSKQKASPSEEPKAITPVSSAIKPPPQLKPRPEAYTTKKPPLISSVPGSFVPAVSEIPPTMSAPQTYNTMSVPSAPLSPEAPPSPAMSIGFDTPLEAPIVIPPGGDILSMFAVTKPIPPVGVVPEEFMHVRFEE